MPVACFPAVGDSMERRLRLQRAVDKFHFLSFTFCKWNHRKMPLTQI